MWNGEGVDDHPLRNLEDDDEKVNQLIAYLLVSNNLEYINNLTSQNYGNRINKIFKPRHG